MGLPSTNILTSRIAIGQRFTKLYRKLYHSFIKRDIVHLDDYKKQLNELNTRIATIEAALNTCITMSNTNATTMFSHTHTVTTAVQVVPVTGTGAGIGTAIPAIPSGGPPVPTPPSATKLVVYNDAFKEKKDAALQGTGPATAPLADSMSQEGTSASTQIKKDIGT